MHLWDLRAAPKTGLSLGNWQSGKMKKSSFPLSKARTKYYRLGSAFSWRLITFFVNGSQYRILVSYRTDKEQFSAILGMDVAGDTRVIARLEFHGTHPGWHVHHCSGDIEAVPSGIRVGPWLKRRDCDRHKDFGLDGMSEVASQAKAMTIVSEVFGLRPEGGMI